LIEMFAFLLFVAGRSETASSGAKHHVDMKKKAAKSVSTKDDRRNHAKQVLQNKRAELFSARRAGTAEGAPKLIVCWRWCCSRVNRLLDGGSFGSGCRPGIYSQFIVDWYRA